MTLTNRISSSTLNTMLSGNSSRKVLYSVAGAVCLNLKIATTASNIYCSLHTRYCNNNILEGNYFTRKYVGCKYVFLGAKDAT